MVQSIGKAIPATQARVRFGELLRRVEDEPVLIERGGKPVAVVLSFERYQEIQQGLQRTRHAHALVRASRLVAAIESRRGMVPVTAPEEVLRGIREERREKSAPDLR